MLGVRVGCATVAAAEAVIQECLVC
eukprot:COSAG01_NODE_54099_length_334_cov_0.982979_1_plen_24_part_01